MDPSAAKLLMPYLGWTLFASALNYNIWANNTDQGGRHSHDQEGRHREAGSGPNLP